jgi:hypothetical protein
MAELGLQLIGFLGVVCCAVQPKLAVSFLRIVLAAHALGVGTVL